MSTLKDRVATVRLASHDDAPHPRDGILEGMKRQLLRTNGIGLITQERAEEQEITTSVPYVRYTLTWRPRLG